MQKSGRWFHAQKIASFSSLTLLIIVIIATFSLGKPSEFQSTFFRTITAILAAITAYSLPGSMAISLETGIIKFTRAITAFFVFLVVYFFYPTLFN